MATSTARAGQAFSMPAAEAAAAAGGRLIEPDGGRAPIRGVSTDSRTLAAGNLFVALTGERFDGHDHVASAAANGASAALVSTARAGSLRGAGVPLIAVDDPLLALGRLGRAWRDRFDVPVVGITGSAGKSTAKEMTAAVLGGLGPVLKTEGNLNNRIGVPLTLASLDASHRAAVVEMGISLPGEMAALTGIVRPSVRVVLLAGAAHVEFLRDVAGVAEEKCRIFDGAAETDCLVWNDDDPFVAPRAASRATGRRFPFGRGAGARVRATRVESGALGRLAITLALDGTELPVEIPVFGEHHATNALAAAAVGTALGIAPAEIASGLANRFRPMPGRGDVRLLGGDVVLLDDTYNANPVSCVAALRALAATRAAGRRRALAALGDMLELGVAGPSAHAGVGRLAGELGLDALFTVGDLSAHAADAAASSGVRSVRRFRARKDLAEGLIAELAAGDAVLLKGSRGSRMDEVVSAVVAARGGAA